MRQLIVAGVSADGRSLLLSAGDETFTVPLPDVHAAQQIRLPDVPEPARPAPTPREIQHRIRHGESAADIARTTGAPVEAVARYEGPALAEREHQARLARRAEVDGRIVEELVAEHMVRMAQPAVDVAWDSWLTDAGRWEVRAGSGRAALRLSWDPRSRRVNALDEPGRQALRLGPIAEDALGAVLRPLSGHPDRPVVARPAVEGPALQRPSRPALDRRVAPPVPLPELGVTEQPPADGPATHADPSEPVPTGPAAAAAEQAPVEVGPAERRTPELRPVPGRKGRAQVPAWDQISMGLNDRNRRAAQPRPQRPAPGAEPADPGAAAD